MSDIQEFHREHLGMPPRPTEEEIFFRQLAEEYMERTEAYDRTVCTGPIRYGSILPIGPSELYRVSRHARQVRDEIEARIGYNRAACRQLTSAIARQRMNKKQ